MRIVFVADAFYPDFAGGSEQSLQAIVHAAPVPITTVRSHDFRINEFDKNDFLIFGNFSNIPVLALAQVAKKFSYAVIESDYKYCVMRSPEKHNAIYGMPCNCDTNEYGRRIIDFYMGAKALFWKTNKHLNHHLEKFPELKDKNNIVLSVTYTDDELAYLGHLRPALLRFGYAVFKTDNWIKGYKEAVEFCKKNRLVRIDIERKNWHDTMKILARSKGLVFLPRGLESCSRVCVEAKILGCKVIANENAPVTEEHWFNDDARGIIDFLRGRTRVFWDIIASVTNIEKAR